MDHLFITLHNTFKVIVYTIAIINSNIQLWTHYVININNLGFLVHVFAFNGNITKLYIL